tara:strand:- start:23030 stop:23485 length:456 start_codon:yes stop_codon:yes gene_type:complete
MSVKIYKSIKQLPIGNFDILCKTKDYRYLLHNEFEELSEDEDYEQIWSSIYDEFLERYGLGEDYKEWCKLMRKASQAIGDVYLNGKKWRITHANIYRQMADDLIKNVEVGDLNVTCATLSKFNGFRINPMEISVVEFYSYLEVTKTENSNG